MIDYEKNKLICFNRLKQYKTMKRLNNMTIEFLLVENTKLDDLVYLQEKSIGKAERMIENLKRGM